MEVLSRPQHFLAVTASVGRTSNQPLQAPKFFPQDKHMATATSSRLHRSTININDRDAHPSTKSPARVSESFDLDDVMLAHVELSLPTASLRNPNGMQSTSSSNNAAAVRKEIMSAALKSHVPAIKSTEPCHMDLSDDEEDWDVLLESLKQVLSEKAVAHTATAASSSSLRYSSPPSSRPSPPAFCLPSTTASSASSLPIRAVDAAAQDFAARLSADVAELVAEYDREREPSDHDCVDCAARHCRLRLMQGLKERQYEVVAKKTEWKHAKGFPSGQYEFLQVLPASSRMDPFFVDVNFRSQFGIARACPSYSAMLSTLPVVFVGQQTKLRRVLRVMVEAIRVSMRSNGMDIPPWRRAKYIAAKWFGLNNEGGAPSSSPQLNSSACEAHKAPRRQLSGLLADEGERAGVGNDDLEKHLKEAWRGGSKGSENGVTNAMLAGLLSKLSRDVYSKEDSPKSAPRQTDWKLPAMRASSVPQPLVKHGSLSLLIKAAGNPEIIASSS